jgi:putative tricarboxylic transport membrane protein
MPLDRILALFFLVVSAIYGFAAYNYPLLPFERNMVFLPNTLPMALSALGAIISLVILLAPRATATADADGLGDISAAELKHFEFAKTFGLIAAMVLYALLLRPVGFLAATTLFIAGSSVILGERKFHLLVPIAIVTAGLIWYLVQETLGIFLRPLPAFLS